ncbi:MAG: ATP synthase F1 subunit gamma [Oligoflexales bacterium]
MPSLKDTKRRIVSVKNTQKITRAMKLVSSAKYARANRAIVNAGPYEQSFKKMIQVLIEGEEGKLTSPLLEQSPEKRALVVVVSSDRGLCGGLNSNLFKACNRLLKEKQEQGIECELGLWGKRAVMFGQKISLNSQFRLEKVLENPSFSFANKSAANFCTWFEQKKFDRIFVVYSKFKNAMTQVPTVDQLLPVQLDDKTSKQIDVQESPHSDFIFEPTKVSILESAVAKKVASSLYHILLNGAASEHAARMTAMDSATNNAEEVIRSLTLEYNRARQAAITKELIEITSGAEAL